MKLARSRALRRPAAALLAVGCLFLAACGSAARGAPSSSAVAVSSPAGSLEALWRSGTKQAGVVAGSTDYQPGSNRVSFLIVDSKGAVIPSPTATVLVA